MDRVGAVDGRVELLVEENNDFVHVGLDVSAPLRSRIRVVPRAVSRDELDHAPRARVDESAVKKRHSPRAHVARGNLVGYRRGKPGLLHLDDQAFHPVAVARRPAILIRRLPGGIQLVQNLRDQLVVQADRTNQARPRHPLVQASPPARRYFHAPITGIHLAAPAGSLWGIGSVGASLCESVRIFP